MRAICAGNQLGILTVQSIAVASESLFQDTFRRIDQRHDRRGAPKVWQHQITILIRTSRDSRREYKNLFRE